MKSVDRSPSLTTQATEAIRAAILKGDLTPERLYTASELGRELNVSRTPIREALLELERRGLVRIERNRGVRILSTALDTLVEIFEIRVMLESTLAHLATRRQTAESRDRVEAAFKAFRTAAATGDPDTVLIADRDFHRALLDAAGNRRATELLTGQRDFVLSTGVGTVPLSRTAQECFEDHADIMEAYRAGDAAGAERAMRRHVLNTARMLIRQESLHRGDPESMSYLTALDWLDDRGSTP